MDKETLQLEIKKLELEIELEKLRKYPVVPVSPSQLETMGTQPFHFHDGQVCYKNPCIWS